MMQMLNVIKRKRNLHWLFSFGKRLFAIYLCAFLLYHFLNYFNTFYFLQEIVAFIVYAIARNFFSDIFLEDIFLHNVKIAGAEAITVSIDSSCAGIVPMVLFASLILAIPRIGKRERVKCLLAGLPVLFFANITRLVILLYVGENFGAELFDFWHLEVLKFDLILFVLVIFAACLHYLLKQKKIQIK